MVSAWILTLPWREINQVSKIYEINPKIVGAIIMQESAGNTCATRYEEHYKWTLHPDRYAQINKVSRQTELIHQKTSWGLMQVMGSVARELGHQGPLMELCKPEVGIEYGVKQLLKLKLRHKENLADVIAAYNAGSPRRNEQGQYVNQNYVNQVNRYISEL